MNFSKKVKQLSENTQYLLRRDDLKLLEVELVSLDTKIELYYKAEFLDEICFDLLFYNTSYCGDFLGVIEAFVSMAQKKPIEAIDRLGIKELDFYLRDDNSIPAFSFYSQEIYEILSIGEKLKEAIMPGKRVDESVIFNFEAQNFFELSFSSQIEILEEIYARELYGRSQFQNVEIDCITTDENRIILKAENLDQTADQELVIYYVAKHLGISAESIILN